MAPDGDPDTSLLQISIMAPDGDPDTSLLQISIMAPDGDPDTSLLQISIMAPDGSTSVQTDAYNYCCSLIFTYNCDKYVTL
ncbi:hypothetical protein CgunFtcFv8_005000 [Champsocephalus gunnari]|uniref:Uncharacterized protein n=1 Tax=Champsocephalus gunnari TaxID=52237 RepID=A0AAN8HFS2_CHAGU|nr:hypothetical protein CgunFtcFv8_005000 [Champsocephalus gunnari]